VDRVSAYLALRQLLRLPEHRHQARAAEAIMEALAQHLGQPPDDWAMMGLLLHLDVELAEHNPSARGRIARQQAEAEGLAPALAEALQRCWTEADAAAPLEDALPLAAWLAEHRHASNLGEQLELRLGHGDPLGHRIDQGLQRLGLSSQQAAALATAALSDFAEPRR